MQSTPAEMIDAFLLKVLEFTSYFWECFMKLDRALSRVNMRACIPKHFPAFFIRALTKLFVAFLDKSLQRLRPKQILIFPCNVLSMFC